MGFTKVGFGTYSVKVAIVSLNKLKCIRNRPIIKVNFIKLLFKN